MGSREKYRSPKRFGYVGSPSDFERGDSVKGRNSLVPGSGSRIPVPLRVLELEVEVTRLKREEVCNQVSNAPVQTSSQGGESEGQQALCWNDLGREEDEEWAQGQGSEDSRETSEERELHWLADRSGGEELAEELVTILEESSEEWEEEEEEVIVEVERTARVIEVIEGSEEEEEEVVEGQEAVTIKVEDLEDVIVNVKGETETTKKDMTETDSNYGSCKDIMSEVMMKEGSSDGLVQAVPAVVVEDVGGLGSENQPVGQFCQGEYENLAPVNQYYEQVEDHDFITQFITEPRKQEFFFQLFSNDLR